MLKQKRALALLIAALTVLSVAATAFAVFDLEGVSLEGVVITKSVQMRDGDGKKAGKLYEGDVVTIIGAYGDKYFINYRDVWHEVPMSSMAVFYDDAYLATAKKSIKVYTDIIEKSKYQAGKLSRGSEFYVYGRIGNWYVLYMTDTEEVYYIPVKNVDVHTGRDGS